jgi:hypothetical protein
MKNQDKKFYYMMLFFVIDHLGRKIPISRDIFHVDSEEELNENLERSVNKYAIKFSSTIRYEIIKFKPLQPITNNHNDEEHVNAVNEIESTTKKRKSTKN